MFTAEQLQKYWDANPAALEQAIQSNPTAFGLSGSGMLAPTNGMGDDGYQLGAVNTQIGTSNAQTGTQQDISTGVPNLGQRDGTTPDLSPLELIRQQNQAYNAANPVPDGFVMPTSPEGVPLWQMGGGFGGATQAASYALNQLGAGMQGQTFDEYLNQGTATQQQTRTDTFNLGGTSQIRPDGTLVKTPSDVPVALQGEVKQALNAEEQRYIDELQGFFSGTGSFPERADVYGILNDYGFPSEIKGSRGEKLKLNPVTGQYEGARRPGDSTFASLVKQTPAIMGAVTGLPIASALGSGLTTATQGGDLEDILKSAATAGLTTGVTQGFGGNGLFDGMSEGAIRSGLEGATREAITQAIQGNFDLGDIAISGLTSVGVKAVTSAIADHIQTSEYTPERVTQWLKEGVIDQTEADRLSSLYQQTSAGGLFGPNAFLNKYSGVGEDTLSTAMPASVISAIISPISEGIDLILNTPVGQAIADSPITRAALDAIGNLMGVANPTPEQVKEFKASNYNLNPKNPDYAAERARLDYDLARKSFEMQLNTLLPENERYNNVLGLGLEPYKEWFFEEDAPRGDVNLEGIWKENPYTTQGGPGQSPTEPLPQQEKDRTQEILEALPKAETPEEKAAESALEEAIKGSNTELNDVSKDALEGALDAEEGELSLGAPPGWGDTRLPSGGDTDLPLGGDTDLPTGGKDTELPSSVDNPLPTDSTGTIEPDELPTTTGGGGTGGGGGGGVGAAALAAGIGGDDFKKFMASIDYVAPILRELNIPLTDYMAMWIQGNKA